MESKRRGMTFECRIATPMYERNQKRYLEFELTEPTVRRVRAIHERAIDWCVDPLRGTFSRSRCHTGTTASLVRLGV